VRDRSAVTALIGLAIAFVVDVTLFLVPFVGVVAVARDEGMGVMLPAVGGLLAVFFAFRILAW
jgi:hypothetical protein